MKQTLVILLAALVATSAALAQRSDRDRRPPRPDREQREPGNDRRPRGGQRYSIEQAVSDRGQLHTIAFSGVAFLTGDFGASTFIPPDKVCDYFGFQYMRDIDAAEKVEIRVREDLQVISANAGSH